MSIRFINKKAEFYHAYLATTPSYLLLVTWGEHSVQHLMTVEAFQCFKGYLSPMEAATVQLCEILPESALRLGFNMPLQVEDIRRYFGFDPDDIS